MTKTFTFTLEFTQDQPQINEHVLGYTNGLYEIFTYAGRGLWLKHGANRYTSETLIGPQWWTRLPYWDIKDYARTESN